eukprot:GHRR01027386.1.p1 GENE.GHRR01027386.1~~GHRR01027386.1.p1  ORF type:complete len:1037 (+),score=479.42 GHRR01027386.1:1366-4476(+)
MLSAAPARAAAAARKRHRKALVMSDSDAEQDADAADSDFEAAAGDDASNSECETADLVEEAEDDDNACNDATPASTGSKRKRPANKAASKRLATATPASKVANKGKLPPVPSSGGHTPMDRFSCGSKSTPVQGFPGFTPPGGAQQAGDTPIGLFGQASTASGASTVPTPARCSNEPLALTPDPAARAALQGALDLTPAASDAAKGDPAIVLGVLASGGAEAARFAARMAERFPFLHPKKIRDKTGKRPSDREYNPRTLLIPDAANWFKAKKVTEAQQQWWKFKADNFDSVLLFKVGKFYEMFEMDAFVGVDVLGLSFMKGDQPHAGFPEAAYRGMAEQLARAGYRVVVVEQTETPEQLRARNAARPAGQKMVNVVDRQQVAVLSRGTLMDPEMVAAYPDAAYVLAVVEVPDGSSGHDAPFIGACALDTAAGQVLLGSWRDDEVRLKLRTQLTGLRPVELVLPKRGSGAMTATTSRLCRCGGNRGPAPALNELPASTACADATAQAMRLYFPEGNMPRLLQQLLDKHKPISDSPAGGELVAGGPADQQQSAKLAEAGLGALGLMVQFLRDNMLDAALLPTARFEALFEGAASASDEPVAMELNGAALEGLEILENALGGTTGSLLGLLDHCATPFGRRRLRRWLTRPLYRIRDITRRQDAVEELMGDACSAVSAARRALAGCCDLERCLARLAGTAAAGGFGREAAHVVLYEDQAKRRVKVLVAAMRDLQALQQALEAFGKLQLKSELLVALSDGSRWSDFQSRLDDMTQAAEWEQAERLGVVQPSKPGLDPAYDEAKAAVDAADRELQSYLTKVHRELACQTIQYTSLNKESHVLEVPDAAATAIPSSYCLVGHRKGFKRYSSDRLKELVAARQAAEDNREKVEAGVLQSLERLFVSHHELWVSAIEAVAVLDCLMALAGAALAADGVMCRPKLLELAATGSVVFRAGQLRHPAGLASTAYGSFVPNDIQLGGDAPSFILLTGPNMGGKSTLLRQVCLAAVLAQVRKSLKLAAKSGCITYAMDGLAAAYLLQLLMP